MNNAGVCQYCGNIVRQVYPFIEVLSYPLLHLLAFIVLHTGSKELDVFQASFRTNRPLQFSQLMCRLLV